MPSAKAPAFAYQLKVTLIGIKPPIWRRILVPGTLRLSSLHDAIQAVMGWSDCHLHQFAQDGEIWGVPEDDEFGGLAMMDESKAQVSKLLGAKGDSMIYLYDFGDCWEHKVVLENIIPLPSAMKAPICTGGARRCPPEDAGGPPGYAEFLEVIFDPSHEDYEHLVCWAGGPYHAEEFDLQAVNTILERMRWPVRPRR